jgi:hypothetical protein
LPDSEGADSAGHDSLSDIDAAAWALGRAASSLADNQLDEADFEVEVDEPKPIPRNEPRPAGLRETRPSSGSSHSISSPAAAHRAPASSDSVLSAAARGKVATPWDDGPSRTSAVTIESDDFDALAEPTPLPPVETDRFFGRNTPLPGLQSDLIFPRVVTPLMAPPIPIPKPPTKPPLERFQVPFRPMKTASPVPAPDITFDDPVELTDSIDLPADETPEDVLRAAQDRFQLHDFQGAIEILEKVVETDPMQKEARALLLEARSQLMRMYESKLGGLDRVPRVLISSEELIWLNLNHRAGFILSQIDGSVSYDDIIALSGMPRIDTLKILTELIQERVIGSFD